MLSWATEDLKLKTKLYKIFTYNVFRVGQLHISIKFTEKNVNIHQDKNEKNVMYHSMNKY